MNWGSKIIRIRWWEGRKTLIWGAQIIFLIDEIDGIRIYFDIESTFYRNLSNTGIFENLKSVLSSKNWEFDIKTSDFEVYWWQRARLDDHTTEFAHIRVLAALLLHFLCTLTMIFLYFFMVFWFLYISLYYFSLFS